MTNISNKKACIINVGVNASHGNLRSPIFEDGTFVFVPIPETREPNCPYLPTYEEIVDPQNIPLQKRKWRVHNDPEFITCTYGDFPETSPRAANLKRLCEGDYLFFLSRLILYKDGKFTEQKGFYLIGFFEIEKILRNINEKPNDNVLREFEQNAHIKRGLWKPTAFAGSWIFMGSKNSMLFKYAVPFNKELAEKTMTDSKGEKWKWPSSRTDLQVIGSYLRSSYKIEGEPLYILWQWIKSVNEVLVE